VHSLSHSLGGVNPRLHHGTLNAMFLPAVLQFNAEAENVQKENRMARMAQAMGLGAGKGGDVAEAVRDMNARLGLPTGLGAMGVGSAEFSRVIEGALADHCHKMNPRLASADDYQAILDASM
jgi:alcohol dehydrogenase class IV